MIGIETVDNHYYFAEFYMSLSCLTFDITVGNFLQYYTINAGIN